MEQQATNQISDICVEIIGLHQMYDQYPEVINRQDDKMVFGFADKVLKTTYKTN